MSEIIIPNPERKRALFIIGVQPGFIQPEHKDLIPNIVKLIKEGEYEAFVLAEFRALKGTLWDRQMGRTFPHAPTPVEISSILDPKKTTVLIKNTKSVFTMKPYLAADLRMKDIEEIHYVGYDLQDGVLATADNGFDLGFYSYVIEEAAESGNDELKNAALTILRKNEMTNHSKLIMDKKVI